jgi:hypothetical protein
MKEEVREIVCNEFKYTGVQALVDVVVSGEIPNRLKKVRYSVDIVYDEILGLAAERTSFSEDFKYAVDRLPPEKAIKFFIQALLYGLGGQEYDYFINYYIERFKKDIDVKNLMESVVIFFQERYLDSHGSEYKDNPWAHAMIFQAIFSLRHSLERAGFQDIEIFDDICDKSMKKVLYIGASAYLKRSLYYQTIINCVKDYDKDITLWAIRKGTEGAETFERACNFVLPKNIPVDSIEHLLELARNEYHCMSVVDIALKANQTEIVDKALAKAMTYAETSDGYRGCLCIARGAPAKEIRVRAREGAFRKAKGCLRHQFDVVSECPPGKQKKKFLNELFEKASFDDVKAFAPQYTEQYLTYLLKHRKGDLCILIIHPND